MWLARGCVCGYMLWDTRSWVEGTVVLVIIISVSWLDCVLGNAGALLQAQVYQLRFGH